MKMQNEAYRFRHTLLLGGLLGSTLLLSACIEFTTECEVDPATCSSDDSSHQEDTTSNTITHTPTAGIPQLTASPTFSHNPVGLGGWTTLNIPVDEDTQGVAIHFAKLDAADMTDYHSTGGPLDSYYKDKTTGSTNVSLEIVANYAHSEHYYMIVSLCSMPWTYVADGQSYNCDNGTLVRYSNTLVGSNPIQQSTSNYYFQEQLASGNIGETDFSLAKLVIDDTSNVSNRNNATFRLEPPENATQINGANAMIFDSNGDFIASTLNVTSHEYTYPVYDMTDFDLLTETLDGLLARTNLTAGDYTYWLNTSYWTPLSALDNTPTFHAISSKGSFTVSTGVTLIDIPMSAFGEKMEVAREVTSSVMNDASAVPSGNSFCLWSLPGTKPLVDKQASMGVSSFYSSVTNPHLASGTYDLTCIIDVDSSIEFGSSYSPDDIITGYTSGDALAAIENIVVDHSTTATDATTTVSNDYVWTLKP